MGQQQLLLIILGVIIVGIAIAVAITLYDSWSVISNKDALMNDLHNTSVSAYAFYMKVKIMGGGGGSYSGFDLPAGLKSNANGDIAFVTAGDGESIEFTATSKLDYGTIKTTMNDLGKLTPFVFTGRFNE
ncbi:MAG: hypothetical protein KKG06_02920 [Bacteroidetes bacterium]|nr:hypothetical protein [Bacteroidota bacterium]